ncbi:hypothetical protein AYK26_06715 [Euryarchaeota archaeon SM23-78]|nr:MAG: hypothetical protein AYK26_06715 [Euryarchaeota archaeon SM23-78]MBW3001190.1 hypothetical protein [Candidatus Woesearchaeota archaeon]
MENMAKSLEAVMVWLIYSMFFDYSRLPGYSEKKTDVLDTLQNAFEAGIPIGLTNPEFAKDHGIIKEIIEKYDPIQDETEVYEVMKNIKEGAILFGGAHVYQRDFSEVIDSKGNQLVEVRGCVQAKANHVLKLNSTFNTNLEVVVDSRISLGTPTTDYIRDVEPNAFYRLIKPLDFGTLAYLEEASPISFIPKTNKTSKSTITVPEKLCFSEN